VANRREERRLNILHIIPSFQHPKVRGPDRHYRFLKELAQRHDITLLTLVRSEIPDEAMQELSSYAKRIYTFNVIPHSNGSHRSLGGLVPTGSQQLRQFLAIRSAIGQMKEKFQDLVKDDSFDVVLFHGKIVFPVISDFSRLPIVIDFCDATSMRVQKKMNHTTKGRLPLLWLQYLQVRQTERKMVKKTPYVAFISSRDRQAVMGLKDEWQIIPNGLDLQYWKRTSRQPQPNCLVFTGVMNYSPNEDAAIYLIDKILPLLRDQVPNLEILIVGRDPTPALLEKARRHPEVIVTGFVEDMRIYLERAMIFAAPLRFASGMQNKIQEAMAMEVPVVTTSIVAAGMQGADGDNPPIRVADGAEMFSRSIIDLLGQEAERNRLAASGRLFAEKHYDWSRSAKQLEQMCFEAIRNQISQIRPLRKLSG
jgi:glycosyltransferase involved in cell wall biosynthesis